MAIRKINSRSIEDSAIVAADVAAGSITTAKIASSVTLTTPTIDTITSAAATALTLKSAGTTAVTVDTSQNVGIGTSSPTERLHLTVSNASTVSMRMTNTATSSYIAQNGTSAGQAYSQALELGTVSTNPIMFVTNNSYRGIIDSSGNFGIGTTSPTKLLTVLKTQNAETSILVRNQQTGTAAKAIIRFGNDNSDDVGSVGALSSAFTPSGALEADGFYVDSGRQSLNLSASNSGVIKFFGTGTERMRMSGSTLFIGATSSPSGTQRLVLTADGSTGVEPMLLNELRTSSATENYVRFYRNGSQVGTISNTLSATAYNTSSDYRLKQNIAPMTGALSKVAQLKPVTYKWKVDGSNGQGFIAHELQAVVPDCVSGEKDAVDKDGKPEYQGVDVSFLVATLTAAIQELKAENDALKARLDAAGL
jgi:hypothetical protein